MRRGCTQGGGLWRFKAANVPVPPRTTAFGSMYWPTTNVYWICLPPSGICGTQPQPTAHVLRPANREGRRILLSRVVAQITHTHTHTQTCARTHRYTHQHRQRYRGGGGGGGDAVPHWGAPTRQPHGACQAPPARRRGRQWHGPLDLNRLSMMAEAILFISSAGNPCPSPWLIAALGGGRCRSPGSTASPNSPPGDAYTHRQRVSAPRPPGTTEG